MSLPPSLVLALSSFGILLLGGTGCQGRPNERFLEDYVAQSAVTMEHWEYHLGPMLKPGARRSEAIREIVKFLENRKDALPTRFDDYEHLQPPLRARDYWAFALANIAGIEFSMYATHDESIREEKIRTLLLAVTDQRIE